MKKNSGLLYFIFVIGLFFCLISHDFLTEGMFVDGTYYSSISHKIATGQSSFWHLTFSKFPNTEFCEHPPLAFLTQSWFIKIFGDNFYCDKIYSVLTCIITGLLICLIWKKITNEWKSAWMPLLFWTAIPLTTWGATNDLLENTMTIFIVASVYLCLNENKPYLFSIIAGAILYLAVMTKGPTALFPLAFPIIQYFFQKENPFSRYIAKTALMLLTCFSVFAIMLLLSEDSRLFFEKYYHDQILESFSTEPTVNSRFYILWQWLCEMLVGIGIIVVSYIIRHKRKTFSQLANISSNQSERKNAKESLKFTLLGLCGVLPIMISMKQRSFYIIPTLPFFAISLALLFKSIFREPNKLAAGYIISSATIITAITLNIMNFGKVSRDKEMLHDIHEFEKIIPANETILVPESLAKAYSLRGYYSRYFDSTISTIDDNNKFLIMPKEESYDEHKWQSKYELADFETEKYNLYINKSNN